MEISQLAALYVNFIEPLLKILFFAAIFISVLHIFNAMRDGKKHSEIIGMLFNGLISLLKNIFIYAGKGLAWFAQMLLRIIKLIFASVRDFFTSDI
ncbi:MAG: hypothetical protein COY40_04050 [Alphaproteobacteria bacterium CG_4_10_14_0_8_um_filter_53_9]|nr:MAG: hypothetical protein COY40_04050 [Alphaproteobacteria bacterium CG_4_10_14_0_8_um_filter_53_9]